MDLRPAEGSSRRLEASRVGEAQALGREEAAPTRRRLERVPERRRPRVVAAFRRFPRRGLLPLKS